MERPTRWGIRNDNSKGWRAQQMETGRERRTERERQRGRSNKGLNFTIKKRNNARKGASHCWDRPSHLPTALLQVTRCEMDNGAPEDAAVHGVAAIVKSEMQREILLLGSVCKVPHWVLSSRLRFFYFWLASSSFLFFFPLTSFSPHLCLKGEFVNCHWMVSYLRHLCHIVIASVAIASRLWLCSASRRVWDVAQDLILRARADLSWCQSLRRA